MIINNSTISLQQQHQKITISEQVESLTIRLGQQENNRSGEGISNTLPPQVSIEASQAPHKEQHDLDDVSLSPKDELRILILSKMIEALTGEKFKLFDPATLHNDSGNINPNNAVSPNTSGQQSAGFGIEYDYYASHYEYESVSFSAEGTITTNDGRTISFSTQLNMEREFFEEQSFTFRAGDAVKIDPLVLNFNGSSAELQETRFEFDLDSDGQTEQIALLTPGNAYLALDKNNDGQINNGSELFGPSTGQGFAELAQYDEDGNNFIDEADSIYNDLRLWFRDGNGQEQLIALGDKNVGAIYLGHLNTPFELRQNQQTLGDLASTGVYFNEDGTTGFIQQIDLRV